MEAPAISMIESGKRKNLRYSTVEAIASALGAQVTDLGMPLRDSTPIGKGEFTKLLSRQEELSTEVEDLKAALRLAARELERVKKHVGLDSSPAKRRKAHV
jgi:transcriptional regulator with XRE-family HTH domain